MKAQRKKRLFLIIFIVTGVSAAAALALYALKQNINLYYTPSQLQTSQLNGRVIRVGGLVEKGSVHFAKQGLEVSFVLTDYTRSLTVQYNGILPTLFREGQGIIAQGKLSAQGVLIADQVLAKHDEKYMPPEIK